jgi:uncharacterized protein
MNNIDLNEFMPLSIDKLSSLVDEENYPAYINHLTALALEGSFEAVDILFDWYYWGSGHVEVDEKKGIELVRIFAEKHRSPEAAQLLGKTYRFYVSDDESDEKSLQWYLFAAELQDAEACFEIGEAYHLGLLGLEEDDNKAIEFLEKAINYGHIKAYGLLSSIFSNLKDEDSQKKARNYLLIGAKVGDADCQFRISQQLISENLGVNDLKNGISWLIKSATQGHNDALLNLGSRYISGDGLDKDLVEGFINIEKAAIAHSKKAQAYLSSMYLLGIGVEKNLTMAYAWIRLAELNSRSFKIENLSFTCKLLRAEALTNNQLKHAEEFIKKFSADYKHRYKIKD